MRIFNQNGKVNFVDERNVVLGYELEPLCCEEAGWFISDVVVDPSKPLSKSLLNESELDVLNGILTNWYFDPFFLRNIEAPEGILIEGVKIDEYNGCSIAVFRIVNGTAEKFIHLFNIQNGYYTHNFTFETKGGL